MDATARQLITARAERNRAFVRDLLAEHQPAFAAMLETALACLGAQPEVTAP